MILYICSYVVSGTSIVLRGMSQMLECRRLLCLCRRNGECMTVREVLIDHEDCTRLPHETIKS